MSKQMDAQAFALLMQRLDKAEAKQDALDAKLDAVLIALSSRDGEERARTKIGGAILAAITAVGALSSYFAGMFHPHAK